MIVGGVAVTDALRRLPEITFVKLALVRLAPERSVPAILIPDKSVLVSAAAASDTLGPTMTPLRNTYPVGNVAVVVPVRPAVRIFVRVATVKIVPDTSEFVRTTFERSTLVRLALVIRTLLPKMDPPRPRYPAGRMVAEEEEERPMIPRERILARVAPVRVAPVRSVDTNIAFVKLARLRVAPYRDTFVKSAPERSAP